MWNNYSFSVNNFFLGELSNFTPKYNIYGKIEPLKNSLSPEIFTNIW